MSISNEYTTADFRSSMSDAFEAARYHQKTVHVSRHGKRWVSIVSPESALHLDKINSLGEVGVSEIKQALQNIDKNLRIEDLLEKLVQNRTKDGL